jgi:hypothetical protein
VFGDWKPWSVPDFLIGQLNEEDWGFRKMNHFCKFKPALLLALLLLTCASNASAGDWLTSIFGSSKSESATEYDSSARPAWIDNPGNGASASAGMHVRGKAAQEELAVMRAREEYAKRYGVAIESEQGFSTTVENGRASTVAAHVSHEETHQSDVKAVVKAKWRDPETDVLWVWVVASN